MAKMIRKQIYIAEQQEALLKREAEVTGVSEAEIIRQALDARLAGERATTAATPEAPAAGRTRQREVRHVPAPAAAEPFRPEYD